MEREELVSLLTQHQVPFETWMGTGRVKTVDALILEIREGECHLVSGDHGRLLRKAKGVGVEITFERPGTVLRLTEDRQVFKNGEKQSRQLDTSLSETMKGEETAREACIRGIEEELGIQNLSPEDLKTLTFELMGSRPVHCSSSYPGLLVQYQFFRYRWRMPRRHYRPEGYIEVADDHTTYFIWKEAEKKFPPEPAD